MKNILKYDIASSHGAKEGTEVYMTADTGTGEVQLVISKTIKEYYPITEYENVMALHEALNRGGGRKVVSLKDLC